MICFTILEEQDGILGHQLDEIGSKLVQLHWTTIRPPCMNDDTIVNVQWSEDMLSCHIMTYASWTVIKGMRLGNNVKAKLVELHW